MLSLCAALCLPLASMAQAVSAEDAAFVAATVPVSVPSPPLSLNEHPQIRAGVFKLLGYARGSYTQDNTLIARQVLDSMRRVNFPGVFNGYPCRDARPVGLPACARRDLSISGMKSFLLS